MPVLEADAGGWKPLQLWSDRHTPVAKSRQQGTVAKSRQQGGLRASTAEVAVLRKKNDRRSVPRRSFILQIIEFGFLFNQSLDKTALPSGLKAIIFGQMFNQSLDNTSLPSGIQDLTFGHCFDQSLDNS